MKGIKEKDIEEALKLCTTQVGKCTKCPYYECTDVCYLELQKDAYYYSQRLKRRAKLPRNVATDRGQRSE